MSKLFWQSLLAVPAALGAAVAVSGSAIAAEAASTVQVSNFNQDSIQLAQITSVSELTDVLPSDWAFQALQSLVENYGCIQGYPDRTFRGQRSMTRFEFAAGLNACLDVIATLIAQGGFGTEDLATIRRLQEEFQAELATLRGRVDALEAETATLRAQQFSTTTKLNAQVDMHVITPFDILEPETSTSVAARARLNFDTSFTGNDLLRVRLQGGEGNAIDGLNGLANTADGGYNLDVTNLYYSFPLGNRITLTASARGLANDDWVVSTIVPFDGPSVLGAGAPAFYGFGGTTGNGAGLGINFALTDNIFFDAGYTASNPGATDPSIGIFAASSQSYIAQLSFLSDGFLDAAVAYLRNDLVGNQAPVPGGVGGGTDTFAGLLNLDFGGFFVAGHGAWSSFEGGDTFSWNAGLGFNDFLAEGAQLGIYGGELPSVTDAKPFFVEGYYQIPFNQFLTITPALIYGNTNAPGVDDTTGFWGAIRATFRF
ncbi:MAG: S-layer protein [Leptolyngbya sp. DLM2.Bin27]|nr:MAG: S-layer protein [Leptolyngbya sp. DLM2.Bin27]